ncbi:MAG: phosphatidylglycerophosphatase A [Candidatus Cloacimonetes bacterium]|nr:phosphatidylglycerophosphatase A [Candidatus Cloacimonadota bacterium]
MNKQNFKFSVILSTFFGIGFFPKAPGTFATLIALILYWFLSPMLTDLNIYAILASSIVLFVFFSIVASYAERILGKDPGCIVIDEVFGYFLSVIFLPRNITIAIAAFIIFRLLDIFKPFPINKSQELKDGWGVMVDDVIAGMFTFVIIKIVLELNII